MSYLIERNPRSRFFPERESGWICRNAERVLRQRNRGRAPHARLWWSDFARGDQATLARIRRCRRNGQCIDKKDARRLADWLGVRLEVLLKPADERLRTGRTLIFQSGGIAPAGLAALTRQVNHHESWFLERRRRGARPNTNVVRRFRDREAAGPEEWQLLQRAQHRAWALRKDLELGRGPLTSLRWVLELLQVPVARTEFAGLDDARGVVSGLVEGTPYLALTQHYAALPWFERRWQLSEALWRLLLRDRTRLGVEAGAAARAFLVPDFEAVPAEELEARDVLLQRFARAYGVSAALVRCRLDDWRRLTGGGSRRKWPRSHGPGFVSELPSPFAEQEDFLAGV